MNDIEQYATFNFQLRKTNETADDVPADLAAFDTDAAYAVQDLLVTKLCEAWGTTTFGYKIGCTSEGAQQLLNTDGPVYGRLLQASKFSSPVALDPKQYTMMVIEPEFAFEMAEDVPAGGVQTAGTIADLVAAVIPSIEVVHHHLGGWDVFDAPRVIADNAIHACWVSGDPTGSLQGLDLPNHQVTLYADGTEVSSGRGEIALGNPLNALAWIANILPKYGKRLKAGEIVTTGVCMPVYPAQAGQAIKADFGSLGTVEIQF